MSIPVIVDFELKPQLVLNPYLSVGTVKDKEVVFSNVLTYYLYIKEIRAYIHTEMGELIHAKFSDLFKEMSESNGISLKNQYKNITKLGLNI